MDTGDAPALKIGDRVRLRDGGPAMHVAGMSPNMAYCNWVDGEGEVRHGTFDKRRLVVITSPLPPPRGAGS